MQTIIDWFNNTWVVGIIGGIFSGLIVNYLSRFFLSKKENREYSQNLFHANREVIYSIRPGISEGVIPKPETVEALIISTARKYTVTRDDLYGPVEIAQELTKEVMDSSFISSQLKKDYCDQLIAIVPAFTIAPIDINAATETDQRAASRKRKESTIELASKVLGIFSGVTAFGLTLFKSIESSTNTKNTISEIIGQTNVLLPLGAAMITLGIAVALSAIKLVVKNKSTIKATLASNIISTNKNDTTPTKSTNKHI